MKKRIGLITLHYVDNIGGVLLAYALQDSINRFGYDCRIIDFDPTPIPSYFSFLSSSIARRMEKIPKYIRDFPLYAKLLIRNRGALLPPRHQHGSVGLRKRRFDDFRNKHIRLGTQQFRSSSQLQKNPPSCDAYVCGSDQIWNPFICRSADEPRNEPAYFLAFAPEEKRVSYAPSISIPRIPDNLRQEMSDYINRIPFLSCREKQGADLIKELTGRDAEVVLDPTLLLSAQQWDRIVVGPDIREPYMLCYFLGEGRDYRSYAERLRNQTGLSLAVISRETRDMESPRTVNCSDCGPSEFLGLLKNASLVCTDSFHGTIFSIIYQRPFYVFERPGSSGKRSMSTRIHSLLSLLKLSSRLISPDTPVSRDPYGIRFVQADNLLRKYRDISLEYLEMALSRATSEK